MFSFCCGPKDRGDSQVIDINGRRFVFPWSMQRNEAMQLALLFLSAENSQHYASINFFAQHKNLISNEERDDAQSTFSFTSNLLFSTWSSEFMHGADMIPWLQQWIEHYLTNHQKTLGHIQKLRFKEKVTWDISYTITTEENTILQRQASILGQFIDSEWNVYYFYGENKPHLIIRPYTSDNTITRPLLLEEITKSWLEQFTTSIQSELYPLQYNLQKVDNIQAYIDVMREKWWYFRATFVDLINIIFQVKHDTSWLVIWYENLVTHDAFSAEQLFSWDCKIQINEINTNRSLWWKWFGHKFQCDLYNGDKVVASTEVTFFTETALDIE